ncbi:MAG: ABC transporter substrate-binding protein [Silvanigrellaceae bacterium]
MFYFRRLAGSFCRASHSPLLGFMFSSICMTLGSFLPVLGAFAAEPASDSLGVAFDARPRTVDPRFVSTDANSQYLEPMLFLPLFGFSESGLPQGVVAETFSFQGPKSLIIKIRSGLRFRLGRNIDADDVVATYQFILGRSGLALPASPRRGAFERVESVSKISPDEVKFILSEPDASLVSNLVVGILPKEAMALPPDGIFADKGFESGPFVLESMGEIDWILRRNEKYTGAPFGGAFPGLKKIVFKILTDNNTRYAALLKGDVDLVQNGLDTDKISEFSNKRSDAFNVQLRTSDSTAFLAFNLKNKLLSDVRVRRAIGLAINREEILRFTLQGLGQVADSMFPPGHEYHFANSKALNFNTREAETLLDAAGFPDPDGVKGKKERASFTITVPLNRERIAVAKAIAGQLKNVGLKVKVEVLEFNAFMKHLNEGNVQAWIAPWTGYKDGDHLHFVFHSSRIPPNGANRGFYSNKNLDKLLDDGKSEARPAARKALYQRAQSILAEELPYVFLWHRIGHVVTSKNVSGFKIFADGRYSSLTTTQKR